MHIMWKNVYMSNHIIMSASLFILMCMNYVTLCLQFMYIVISIASLIYLVYNYNNYLILPVKMCA